MAGLKGKSGPPGNMNAFKHGSLRAAFEQRLKSFFGKELIPILDGSGGADELRTGKVDVWATSGSNAQRLIDRLPGAKLVPGAFTSEPVMVTLPKGKSSTAQSKVADIVKEAKKSGVVHKAIEKLGLQGVRAAPD
jgi:ABC-type amino acid transport substrate-binding protein